MRIAHSSRVKLKTSVVGFLQFLSLSRDMAPQTANFAIFEFCSKFNASFLSYEITYGDQTSHSCRTV